MSGVAAGSPPAETSCKVHPSLPVPCHVQTMKMRRNGARGPLAASPVAAATRRGPGPVAMPAQQQSQEPVTCRTALVSPQPSQCSSTLGALPIPVWVCSPAAAGFGAPWGGREAQGAGCAQGRDIHGKQVSERTLVPKNGNRPRFQVPSPSSPGCCSWFKS